MMIQIGNSLSRKLLVLYREVYGEQANRRFLRTAGRTRRQDHANNRHIIRWAAYRHLGATLQQIARAEANLLQKEPPHHTTVMNSIDVADRFATEGTRITWLMRDLAETCKQLKPKVHD